MSRVGIVFLILFAFLFSSCATDGSVVLLLTDADGKAGSVVVSNQAGASVISEAKTAVVIPSATSAPSTPAPMDDEAIGKNFGEAISALPLPPVHFNLYFKPGSVELTCESKALLLKVQPTIAEHQSTDISVVGHTDRVGTREYNHKLGLERAHLIRNRLVRLGVREEHIEADSHGEDNPLVKTVDEVQEARNRRVEVIVR